MVLRSHLLHFLICQPSWIHEVIFLRDNTETTINGIIKYMCERMVAEGCWLWLWVWIPQVVTCGRRERPRNASWSVKPPPAPGPTNEEAAESDGAQLPHFFITSRWRDCRWSWLLFCQAHLCWTHEIMLTVVSLPAADQVINRSIDWHDGSFKSKNGVSLVSGKIIEHLLVLASEMSGFVYGKRRVSVFVSIGGVKKQFEDVTLAFRKNVIFTVFLSID